MQATPKTTNLLKTKTHFDILDGLRGIAALAVVIFHFMEFAVPDYHNSFIAHGYLAVDFFFCLSGFVIAYAYDNRMAKLGFWNFIKLRLIRLHPLVIIGSVLGLLTFVFDPFRNLYAAHGPGQTLVMFLTSCLLIPYPAVPERYHNLFHLNPLTWSLFWEYIANVVYALILFRLPRKLLWLLTGIAAVALCYTVYRYKFLGIGWGVENFKGGIPRVGFSFLAGIVVYRMNRIIRSSLSFPVLAVLLLIAFLVPYRDATNQFVEPLLIIVYFPFLITLGVGAHLSPKFRAICKFSGDISYPLYMVHYPFLWLYLSYVEVKKPALSLMAIQIPIFTVLLIGFAYLIMRYVDSPIRNYLTVKFKKTPAA